MAQWHGIGAVASPPESDRQPAGRVHRVAAVLGTRPEVIKLAPIVDLLRQTGDLPPTVVSVDQHAHLLAQALTDRAIVPDVVLRVRRDGLSLGELTGEVTARLARTFARRRFAAVLVQGDTTTALAAAHAAFLEQIPVVHVEAGLRSGDRQSPFPEEANRRMISCLASLHLAPTDGARELLLREGHPGASVVVTGNTVVDALRSTGTTTLDDPRLEAACDGNRHLVVFSMHRRESWGAPMRRVVAAVSRVLAARPDVVLVAVRHPNPVVRDALAPLEQLRNVVVVDALPHPQFLRLLSHARGVMTDSGGVQEEAPSFGTKVLVLRTLTERLEGVRSGASRLVQDDPARDLSVDVGAFVDEAIAYGGPREGNPYGDGNAAARSVAALRDFLRSRAALTG